MDLFWNNYRDSPLLPLWTVMVTMVSHQSLALCQALDFDRDSPCFLGRLSGNATCTQYLLHGQRQRCWMFWGKSGFVQPSFSIFFEVVFCFGHYMSISKIISLWFGVFRWLRFDHLKLRDRISGTLREELAALRFRKPTDAPRRMHFGDAAMRRQVFSPRIYQG